jgi:hypothetical protein
MTLPVVTRERLLACPHVHVVASVAEAPRIVLG